MSACRKTSFGLLAWNRPHPTCQVTVATHLATHTHKPPTQRASQRGGGEPRGGGGLRPEGIPGGEPRTPETPAGGEELAEPSGIPGGEEEPGAPPERVGGSPKVQQSPPPVFPRAPPPSPPPAACAALAPREKTTRRGSARWAAVGGPRSRAGETVLFWAGEPIVFWGRAVPPPRSPPVFPPAARSPPVPPAAPDNTPPDSAALGPSPAPAPHAP